MHVGDTEMHAELSILLSSTFNLRVVNVSHHTQPSYNVFIFGGEVVCRTFPDFRFCP